MAVPRTRILVRGVVAVILALAFGLTAIAGAVGKSGVTDVAPGGLIAPFVVLGIGAVGFVVLAWAAFSLYSALNSGGAVDTAQSAYRTARAFVPIIAVAGLGAGIVTAAAYGEAENALTAAWSTAIVLLAYLLTLRGQGKSVARAIAERA
jgi:hypothetical protein